MSENKGRHDIRFIDSHYNEQFRIPDGGVIEVDYPNRHFSARCEYLDDYHTRISGEVYHICQFAEILERGGGTCRPEAEIQETEAAWRIGYRNYLIVQSCENGWDYTLYDKDFHGIDGGQLDDPALSILEARDVILQNHGMENRSRFPERYESVMEKAEEVSAEGIAASRKSALEKLTQLKGKSSPIAEHPKRKHEQAL